MDTSVKAPSCSEVPAPSSIRGRRASQGRVNNSAAACKAIPLASVDGDARRARPLEEQAAMSPMVDAITNADCLDLGGC
eukprot:472684-Amphidinium_carterae.1